MIHELKTWPLSFKMIESGVKNFEVRKNDRGFKVGDELLLKEFVPACYYEDCFEDHYTTKVLSRKIDSILDGGQFGIEKGYCVMSLGDTDEAHYTKETSEIMKLSQTVIEFVKWKDENEYQINNTEQVTHTVEELYHIFINQKYCKQRQLTN